METEEKKYIEYTDINGNTKKAEVILSFKAGNPSKDYIIYTLNEEVNDMVAMYAAIVTKDELGITLNGINNEEEWKLIKNVMRDIVKENKEG